MDTWKLHPCCLSHARRPLWDLRGSLSLSGTIPKPVSAYICKLKREVAARRRFTGPGPCLQDSRKERRFFCCDSHPSVPAAQRPGRCSSRRLADAVRSRARVCSLLPASCDALDVISVLSSFLLLATCKLSCCPPSLCLDPLRKLQVEHLAPRNMESVRGPIPDPPQPSPCAAQHAARRRRILASFP